ncbi:hypothetical protein DICVIV_01465 [Dictyocaulus viviparus]|uniref:KASH domain-containing protein n=1 Tax=Dictyocaulus viviparus TaxID=29172 RepID=A0A0D8Y695_DICVI|nr:hypothetical protein DICVIV_01465 [Dictyocaulus viviparus]
MMVFILARHFEESSDSELDPDLLGPPTKRIRRLTNQDLFEGSEEEEYRLVADNKKNSGTNSFIERSDTDMSMFSDRLPRVGKKWDSGVLDIGYSSGENSLIDVVINDVNNDFAKIQMMRKRAEAAKSTPMKFQTTAGCDEPTHESFTDVDRNPLTDSMHVNYDVLNGSCPEYDEVMALLEETAPTREQSVSDSFNTKWREIGGGGYLEKNRRRRAHDDDENTKHSCDASSEESSDWESRDRRLMHRSFNDFTGDGSVANSLQNGQNDPKSSSFLLESSPLDASFCSTKSELTHGQCRTRKRLRVRRLPRSMSDGEQLTVKSSVLIPRIRQSPLMTPLARSTRLLQKLDLDLLSNLESDTAPEQSDTQVYEWDEYNPPAKDDSMTEPAASSSPGVAIREDLLEVDEDFSEHFDPWNSLRRLISESRAHLQVVEKSIANIDIDQTQLENIQMIAKANLRQLDTVMQMSGGGHSKDLTDLREQWRLLSEQVASPIPQLLSKVECFANSLRDLHEASSTSSFNTMTDIKSKEDVRVALDVMSQIQTKLSKERDELRALLSSPLMVSELGELSSEFLSISSGYDDAVNRIDSLMDSLQKLDQVWTDWSDELKCIRLETICNYLTSSLQSVQSAECKATIPDFRSEIALYGNAMEQLKTRFLEHYRIPTPPGPIAIPAEPLPNLRYRTNTQSIPTQTTVMMRTNQSVGSQLYKTVAESTAIKLALLLAMLITLAVFLYAGVLGTTFGPHLTYVNGPPPL